MDLATVQSGMFRGRSKISKYGNARLRRTLWLAGQTAVLKKANSFRDKFERYIAQDRHNPDLRRKAYTAIAAKMAPTIHAVIKSGEPYPLAGKRMLAFAVRRPFFEGTSPGGRTSLSKGREIEGLASSILSAERVALNFAGRLSGIAPLTAAFVAETKGTQTRITCTRKTTPGLRLLEKAAVLHGGGYNHRFGLGDAILIKDNHIAAAGGIRPALEAARAGASHMMKIEVEVDTLAQLSELLVVGGAAAVLLDNMDTATLHQAVAMIAVRLTTEASGNMALSRIAEVAATGVNYISAGALTHSARTLDLGLDF